jgi:hypothetical protein
MLAQIAVPLVVMLLGFVIWLVFCVPQPSPPSSPRAPFFARVGEIMFGVGLFWLVAMYAHHLVSF